MRWIILLSHNAECLGENFHKLKYRLAMLSKDHDGKTADTLVSSCWKALFPTATNWLATESMLPKPSEKKLAMMRHTHRKNKSIQYKMAYVLLITYGGTKSRTIFSLLWSCAKVKRWCAKHAGHSHVKRASLARSAKQDSNLHVQFQSRKIISFT